MLHALGDVGDDLRQLRLAAAAIAFGEDAHRRDIFADAVDPAGELELRAESGLEKTFDDLGVGEALLLCALARGDGRDFRQRPMMRAERT